MKKHLLLISLSVVLSSAAVLAAELGQDNAIQDLSEVLMQRRMVPHRDSNTGEINGYRALDMRKGSTFDQVGLQRMDVIKGVNGEPVDSVKKAMELYNSVKMKNKTKLQVERDGKLKTINYELE